MLVPDQRDLRSEHEHLPHHPQRRLQTGDREGRGGEAMIWREKQLLLVVLGILLKRFNTDPQFANPFPTNETFDPSTSIYHITLNVDYKPATVKAAAVKQ